MGNFSVQLKKMKKLYVGKLFVGVLAGLKNLNSNAGYLCDCNTVGCNGRSMN